MDIYITSSRKRGTARKSNERPRYTYPDPVLKIIFVRLLPAEVDDLKHRMNEAMHKLKRKPCKKSEKGRYFCLGLFKVTGQGNIIHAEANYVFTAAAVTNSLTFIEILKTLKIYVETPV